MRANLDFGKIQTFYTKYRPNKDPVRSKGLYYRPRSLNKDPAGSTAKELINLIYLRKTVQKSKPPPLKKNGRKKVFS